MKRVAPLFLAGLVGLAACSDERGALLAPENPIFDAIASGDALPTGQHIVVMGGQKLPKNLAQRVQALGGKVQAAYDGIGVAVVSGLSDAAAAQLQANDDVNVVEPDVAVQYIDPPADLEAMNAVDAAPASPSDPTTAGRYAWQWNMRAIGAPQAWAAGRLGSSDVRVAILDTGLDYTHADLTGLVDLPRSRSFVPSDDAFLAVNFPGAHPIADMHYHGTHVGATVSSNAIAAAGVTSKVRLIGVKVLSRTGSGTTSGVLAGIMYAADAGADVMNMSLGNTFSKSQFPGFVATINRAITYANRQGTLVVVSAGNSNADLDHDEDSFKAYCNASPVVCVSATGPTGPAGVAGRPGPWTDVDAKAPYSNFGRSAVDVAAPGGAAQPVWAACSSFSIRIPGCRAGKTFVVGLSGTSMASPHAAGVAALIVENVGKKQPGLVRQQLHQTADDLGERGTDPIYGKGRINMAKALGL